MGCCMSQPAVYNKVGPDSSPLPAGVEVLVRSDAEAAAAAEVLTRAFAGTASAKPEVGPGPGRRGGWWVGALIQEGCLFDIMAKGRDTY